MSSREVEASNVCFIQFVLIQLLDEAFLRLPTAEEPTGGGGGPTRRGLAPLQGVRLLRPASAGRAADADRAGPAEGFQGRPEGAEDHAARVQVGGMGWVGK